MATKLESGKYVPDYAKTVTVWPKPDKDGDGEEIYVDELDSTGTVYARNLKQDEQGNPVRRYSPPKGFVNKQSFDGSENYVKVDARGLPVRNKNGHAISIREGHTLVEHADGTFEYLTDDYAHALFAKAHSKVSGEEAE
jgi:hypothetical protein